MKIQRRLAIAFAACLLVGAEMMSPALAQVPCDGPNTVFCNSIIPLPQNWRGHVFKMSQDYPSAIPNDVQPWLNFDPTKDEEGYLRAALGYFFEGNIRANVEASFDPALNRTRGWYNAPWQDFGINGREPIHGLTRERVSRPGELDPHQIHSWNNYAVGFYNAPGGVSIGRVWSNHSGPNAAMSQMPDGTVAAKLLFTTAPVQEVPYLQGAPIWSAYVYANPNDPAPGPNSPRAVLPVRLLQIDIAVKDRRFSGFTGWVFGTFVYGGGPGGRIGSGWTNVRSVGAMWGNDPKYPGTGPLTQTALNSDVHMPHVGFQQRLNGPVDNASSSCLSCHSTAETPPGVMVAPKGTDSAPWFRNLPSGVPFDPGRVSLNYSLQLSVGIANFRAQQTLARAPNQAALQNMASRIYAIGRPPPRDGGQIH